MLLSTACGGKKNSKACAIKYFLLLSNRIQEDELAVMKKKQETTKNELAEAQERNKEFEQKVDYFERKVTQLQEDLER